MTIVNNTGDVYEPAVFFTSVQSGDQEADQVFDSENNLTGSPSTAILAGRQSTFTIGAALENSSLDSRSSDLDTVTGGRTYTGGGWPCPGGGG